MQKISLFSIILPAHYHGKTTDTQLKMPKQRYVKVQPDFAFIFFIAKQKVVREVIYVIRQTLNFPVRQSRKVKARTNDCAGICTSAYEAPQGGFHSRIHVRKFSFLRLGHVPSKNVL